MSTSVDSAITRLIAEKQAKGLSVIPWEQLDLAERLAEGAFGTVCRAKALGTTVAVKQVKSTQVRMVLELIEECAIMQPLAHPNILKAMAIATDRADKVGMVMELCVSSLNDLMHSGRWEGVRAHLTWERSLLGIAHDVSCGMSVLHEKGIIHRDIKPLNVMISDGWVAKLADFGEVMLLSANDETEKKEGADRRIRGTPSYVSPEAASAGMAGALPVGKPTDVWSFGCLLAHCAAFQAPYTDTFSSVDDLLVALRNGTVEPLSMIKEGVNMPACLLRLSEECTRVTPDERPTFDALATRLSSPSLILKVMGLSAHDVDEDELEDLEAPRPPIRLVAPRKQLKPPPPPVELPSSQQPSVEAAAPVPLVAAKVVVASSPSKKPLPTSPFRALPHSPFRAIARRVASPGSGKMRFRTRATGLSKKHSALSSIWPRGDSATSTMRTDASEDDAVSFRRSPTESTTASEHTPTPEDMMSEESVAYRASFRSRGAISTPKVTKQTSGDSSPLSRRSPSAALELMIAKLRDAVVGCTAHIALGAAIDQCALKKTRPGPRVRVVPMSRLDDADFV